mmetsp:Transcript_13711/g.57279  ORF Transcript_13711/g.57279 Transcript_13711/m.57279 type:complete len:225 (+) Transcript_13711:2497-3171(+)
MRSGGCPAPASASARMASSSVSARSTSPTAPAAVIPTVYATQSTLMPADGMNSSTSSARRGSPCCTRRPMSLVQLTADQSRDASTSLISSLSASLRPSAPPAAPAPSPDSRAMCLATRSAGTRRCARVPRTGAPPGAVTPMATADPLCRARSNSTRSPSASARMPLQRTLEWCTKTCPPLSARPARAAALGTPAATSAASASASASASAAAASAALDSPTSMKP